MRFPRRRPGWYVGRPPAAESPRWATTTPATCWPHRLRPDRRRSPRLRGLTREAAVAQLLRTCATARHDARRRVGRSTTTPLPLSRAFDAASDAERKPFRAAAAQKTLQLRAWWISEMLATPSPLTERMTLFWHNHFVSSAAEGAVRAPHVPAERHASRHALGNFGTLLHAVAQGSGDARSISTARRTARAQPNENFAREVMELFTLGEGNYSEKDMKEAARAFTGWSLDRETGEFVFRRGCTTTARRPCSARPGASTATRSSTSCSRNPATAEFIVRKLWREFVSPDPDAAEVTRIARRFRESHYDIKTALRALLTSRRVLRAQESRRADQVPDRARRRNPAPARHPSRRSADLRPRPAGMGQNLFSPPNVKGWPGQDTWINASSLLARKQFVDRVLRTDDNAATMRTMTTHVDAMVVVTPLANAPASDVRGRQIEAGGRQASASPAGDARPHQTADSDAARSEDMQASSPGRAGSAPRPVRQQPFF